MRDIPYSSLKEDKRAYDIMVLRDQYNNTFTDIAKDYECESRVEKERKRAENVSMWQTNLIKLYCAVCDNSSTIEAEMQGQSNNFRPQFRDEECITVYLWGISQRRFE